jgi:Tfp pilus assembly protein PilF
MDTHLNLFDELLALARRYQQLGRHRDAAALFARLTAFRDLPADVAEEVSARLAELNLRRRRYAQARRHLTAALRHRPDSARYHYLLGFAWQACDDLEKAADHYRQALEHEPGHRRCLTAYGLLCLQLGRAEEGLAHLREALFRAPDDPEVVPKVTRGLCLAGQPDEARSLLRAALFRNPRSPRFRALWADFQFQQLRRRREEARLGRAEPDEGPVLLPFVRVERDRPAGPACPTVVRHDPASPVPPPHRPRLLRRPRVQ